MRRVISFSGGRTSGLMLRRLLDKYPDTYNDEFIVCFENTGKERNETLDFVHEVETRWDVPIVWLEYCRVPAVEIPVGIFPTKQRNKNHAKAIENGELTHWFKLVNYESAARKGQPFDSFLSGSTALPNPTGRGCSAQLKIRTGMRYLFSIGVMEFEAIIGIRKDEEHRALEIAATCENFLHPKFPLIEDSITEADVIRFWINNDFDLKLKSYEGNCDLCFLKSKWKRLRLIRDNPGMVDWWKQKENQFNEQHLEKLGKSGFRLGESYEGLEIEANHPEFDLADNVDIACSCAEKGFERE